MTAAAAFAALTLALAPPQGAATDTLAPPRVSTGVTPAAVTVGDRFRSYLRVRLPAGSRISLEAFAPNDSLQIVDTVFVRRAGAPAESTVVAVYPLVAWIAGDTLRQSVTLTVTREDGGSRAYRVPLRLPEVRSVLPADSADLRPRPAKGLLLAPAAPSPWWWVLLLVPAALVGALLAWRLRRGTPAAPRLDPRAEALARLARLGEPAPGAAEPLYTAATRVLRQYLARVDGRWGEELTTEEILARVADSGAVDQAALAALLRRADPVKFGAADATTVETRAFAAEVRAWIVGNPREAQRRREAA